MLDRALDCRGRICSNLWSSANPPHHLLLLRFCSLQFQIWGLHVFLVRLGF
ncbi:hypothetical protein CIPAW_03G276500 [Carya illinoinensis]|uniref:Uncharacterized protein n=1 Tax=Carya illinoinensis TaxID=32201 RepID=A0A8T1R704_CARIL|nr:hypothetical protein CIPAW_03G276500 [Carya illinoinensis]